MSSSNSIGYLKSPWFVAYPSVAFIDTVGASSSPCSSTEMSYDDLIVLGVLPLFLLALSLKISAINFFVKTPMSASLLVSSVSRT